MSKQNRTSNLSFLMLGLVILLCLSWVWQLNSQSERMEFSQVEQLFRQEKVESFVIRDNTLLMTLRGEPEGRNTLRYELYDFDLFYDSLSELVEEQAARGVITSYDYQQDHSTNWLEILLPWVLMALLEGGVAAICAHTNLDAAHGGVNGCLAQALELSDTGQLRQAGEDALGRPYGIGRVGTVHREGLSAGEYAAYVKERLHSACVRFVDGGRPVRRVAVGGGACGSMMGDALAMGCDTFVTADLKYDQFLEARALGLNLLDAGHFPTENVVCAPLAGRLAKAFPQVEVRVSQTHKEVYSNA